MFAFRPKKKGLLEGMNEQEKIIFFESLADCATTDKERFEQQYWKMLSSERSEFGNWVIRRGEQQKSMLVMINLIERLLKEKHGR